MKIVITGMHSSGKFELLDRLQQLGVLCGHEFTNCPEKIYKDPLALTYTREDIEIIYESGSYITFEPVNSLNIVDAGYIRGIDLHTWDTNDVFVVSPNVIPNIQWQNIKDHVVFVWIDNSTTSRYKRFKSIGGYDFNHQERIESQLNSEFTELLYNHDVLYFSDDKLEHILGAIYSLINHPTLLNTYKTLYN